MEFTGLTEAKGGRFEGLHKESLHSQLSCICVYSRGFKLPCAYGKLPSGSRARLTRKQKSGGNEVIASGAKTRDAPAHDPDFPARLVYSSSYHAWRISVRNSGIFGIRSLLKSDFVLHTARLATNS